MQVPTPRGPRHRCFPGALRGSAPQPAACPCGRECHTLCAVLGPGVCLLTETSATSVPSWDLCLSPLRGHRESRGAFQLKTYNIWFKNRQQLMCPISDRHSSLPCDSLSEPSKHDIPTQTWKWEARSEAALYVHQPWRRETLLFSFQVPGLRERDASVHALQEERDRSDRLQTRGQGCEEAKRNQRNGTNTTGARRRHRSYSSRKRPSARPSARRQEPTETKPSILLSLSGNSHRCW